LAYYYKTYLECISGTAEIDPAGLYFLGQWNIFRLQSHSMAWQANKKVLWHAPEAGLLRRPFGALDNAFRESANCH
jgi:hypothetical protein